MDMSNIHVAEIIINDLDLEPINLAIKARAQALASQLSPEAADQLISDMDAFECTISADGNSVSFGLDIKESYLVEYLKNHETPVAGGDNGIAHNVDGTTYKSRVDPNLWGTELSWLKLPLLDVEEEAGQILKIMAPDAVKASINSSSSAFRDVLKMMMTQEIKNILSR